ncbi:MAG: molybdopterin-dependent oxidoreductase [Pseudomonadota bacterium]
MKEGAERGETRTTCPYCGVGCGVIAKPDGSGGTAIEGDAEHPANFGRLCSKGSALGETLGLDDRLLYPEVNGERSTWDDTLDLVAARFSSAITEHGPDSVAFYVSGQILTEDYYVANKLMKGFIGSGNIDTNSRLCMASSVAGHRRAFGTDTVPGCYEDLELADVVVLVGSNLLWCHPVLYQRIAAAKAERPHMKVVLIDPRRTKTADLADMHLAIAPDSDTALFNGLLAHLARDGVTDQAYIDEHTSGFEAALAEGLDIGDVARATGLDRSDILAFYKLWSGTPKVVTCYSQGVNQSAGGTDKVNTILNCHLATGRIGKPGAGPFSLTGQPNAMGGRETGGLANMLAAHMDLENPTHHDRVSRFWETENLATKPGLKAVDMFQAVADGRIKAIWIMGTNPAVSMPDAAAVEAAIAACPFVVVSDVVSETDTLRHAHVKLPALAWGEKDGTVTNSERRVSRQRAFMPPPGDAKADWWQLAQMGRRMGFDAGFNWEHTSQVFAEYAALTAFENDETQGGRRDLHLGAVADLDEAAYNALPPFQWPQRASFEPSQQTRFFANGEFYTPNRRARFIAVKSPILESHRGQFRLNTGRIRDQWHTMTRTTKAPRLNAHLAEPYCEMHPADAAALGVADADLVRLSGRGQTVTVRALVSDDVQAGEVFVPMHWNDQFASSARVDVLVPPVTDPVSGQPALKSAPVQLAKTDMACHGFAVSRERPSTDGLAYWAVTPIEGGWRMEFALQDEPSSPGSLLADMAEGLAANDEARGFWRGAKFEADELHTAVWLARGPLEVSRNWAAALLKETFSDTQSRWRVLAGRPAADAPDVGAIICSCMGVGSMQIADAVANGAFTLDAVGSACGAGTNCGSCRAEIGEIISANQLIAAE